MALPEVIKGLLESGVHFGHLSKYWNPKMKKFIFGKKKNVYIIDLEKTAEQLKETKEFLKQVAQSGEQILFVATKKQLRGTIKELACLCLMPYVAERWVGGLLTNFSTVRKRIKKYLELIEKREKGEFSKITKKEAIRLNREIARMEKIYSGVTSLEKLPGCVYVVDPKKEIACTREVNKLSIPIVALIDTDADPEIINYPIPGNDDSIKSVKYITSHLVEAINQGLAKAQELKSQEPIPNTSEQSQSQPKGPKVESENQDREK